MNIVAFVQDSEQAFAHDEMILETGNRVPVLPRIDGICKITQ